MGSANTKGRRSHVVYGSAEFLAQMDSQPHTNGKLFQTNAVEATTTNNVEQVSREQKESDQPATESDSSGLTDKQILDDYVQKNRELEEILSKCFAAVKGLKECLESDLVLSTESSIDDFGEVLNDMYFQREDNPLSQSKLVDFVVALGFPNIARDIFVTLKSRFPEITTWDREPCDDTDDDDDDDDDGDDETTTSREDGPTAAGDDDQNKDDRDSGQKEQGKVNKDDEKRELKAAQDILSGSFCGAIHNFADLNDNFCIACGKAGLVPLLVEMSDELKTCLPNAAKDELIPHDNTRWEILEQILGILYNLSRRTTLRMYFNNCNAVKILAPFLKSEDEDISIYGLLILAHLIDEKNNELIMSDEEPIVLLIRILGLALNESDRRYMGYSSVEVAEGLGRVALNDSNKKKIGKHGGCTVLVKMIQGADTEEEKIVAAETLWTLAFDEENKKNIKKDEEAMRVLQELQQSQDSRIMKAAAGVLWELQGKELRSEKLNAKDSNQHIMISYQWDVQPVVLQIRDKLKSLGFKVWLDVDEMGGSIFDSMATAVQDSSVVLICVSQKYKDSQNCRSEACYSRDLHKDIIPLMMDINYKPDGWLGLLLAGRFYIEFYNKRTVTDSSLEKLVKELRKKGKPQEAPIKALSVDVVDSAPGRPDIRSWTQTDVAKWLKKLALETINIKAKNRLDGTMLIRLHRLRKESPDFFYASLKGDLHLSDVFDVLSFTDALDQLLEG